MAMPESAFHSSRSPRSTLHLPHFDEEVPLLLGTDGLPYVPVAALCRMLDVDPRAELARARRVLLWSSARLLAFELGGRTVTAWCLPYPAGVDSWYWQVSPKVRAPARREQLKRAIDEGGRLLEAAQRRVHQRFEGGRRRMYALARRAARVEALAGELAAEWDTGWDVGWDTSRARVPGWMRAFARACAAQAGQTGAFVRAWLAAKAQLPILDAIRVDAAGNVLDSAVPMSLFATISEEEEGQLLWHEVTCAAVLAQLEAFRRDA